MSYGSYALALYVSAAFVMLPGVLHRSPAGDGRGRRVVPYDRAWDHPGFKSGHRRAAGFVKAAAMAHASTCRQATPEERRAIARLDEARWAKKPPTQDVWNDHNHRGYGNEPVWPDDDE